MKKSINKPQAAALLKSKGYNAEVENGVVMVYAPEKTEDTQELLIQVQSILKEAGYNASYGVTGSNKNPK